MTQLAHGFASRERTVLAIILGSSIVLRCASALLQSDTIIVLPGIQDQVSYDALARSVLAGHGFSFPTDWWPATRAGQPTAHWSFLYTLYLTGVYAVVGIHPLVARLIQASLAGALYPWFAWRLGRRLFGERVGLTAAGLMAGYAYFIYYGGALMTETFYVLGLLWTLDVATGLIERPDSSDAGRARVALIGRWLALGLAVGLTVLLRQLMLLFVPVLFLWLVFIRVRRAPPDVAATELRRTLTGIALSTCVVAALVAPWTLRNYRAFDRFVLLNTNAGYAFFWANHPIHGTDFVSILPGEVYHDLIPQELRTLDEAALDAALMQRGIRFVLDDPGRYALLSLSRVKDYFEFWPSAESSTLSNLARGLSFGIYLPFMIYGLVLSGARNRRLVRPAQGAGLILVCLFGLVYSIIHLLSWALVRYRLPVDAALMPLAAVGAVDLASRALRAYGSRRTARGQSAPHASVPNAPNPLGTGEVL